MQYHILFWVNKNEYILQTFEEISEQLFKHLTNKIINDVEDKSMNKPRFLYHGSRYKVDVLKPHQAYGSPNEKGNEYGIYAYQEKSMVIPFSLTIKSFNNGSMGIYVDDDTSHVTISAGILDDYAIGYIYKVSSKSFEKLDDKQWLSKEEVTPLEITVVNTQDYMHKITFTGSAKEYRMRNQ